MAYVSVSLEPVTVLSGSTGVLSTAHGQRLDCWPIGDGAFPTPGDVCALLFGVPEPPEVASTTGWDRNGLSIEEHPAANWAEEWEPDRYEKVYVASRLLAHFEDVQFGRFSFLQELSKLLAGIGMGSLAFSFRQPNPDWPAAT